MTAAAAPAHDLGDSEIIARVRAGEAGVFELLVRRHNQRLYRAARAVLRSDQDAEDVLQQTWLAIFRALGQFRGDSLFTTWATRIAVNEALAHARRTPPIAEVVDRAGGDTPDDALERAQLGRLLERCLSEIPQGNREVLVLRDVLELDTAETATCLGLSEEAVRVRLHRARAAVAVTLTERMSDEARGAYGFDGARCDRITHDVMRNVSAEVALYGA